MDVQPVGVAITRNPDKRILRQGVCESERMMIEYGLIDIKTIDSSILVDLKYSGTDNFLGKDMYGCLEKAFLQPDVAHRLALAQQTLQQLHPGLSLLVYDAARPLYVQQIIWESLDMPVRERGKFAANPKNGSLHNYGAAVDVTLAELNGKPLDMGADFDHIGEIAYPAMEAQMLADGQLTEEHISNRKLLRKVMAAGGFFNIQTEWWHFNACRREDAQLRYDIIQ